MQLRAYPLWQRSSSVKPQESMETRHGRRCSRYPSLRVSVFGEPQGHDAGYAESRYGSTVLPIGLLPPRPGSGVGLSAPGMLRRDT
jgi:hypothetical protein